MDSDLGLDGEALGQLPFGHPMRRFFAIDPDIAFLNNGSFGACPLPVLAAQDAIRREIERQPAPPSRKPAGKGRPTEWTYRVRP